MIEDEDEDDDRGEERGGQNADEATSGVVCGCLEQELFSNQSEPLP